MPGPLAAYRVVVTDGLTLGLIQLDVSAHQWIARTAGSGKCPRLRRFPEKDDAVRWLQESGPVPRGNEDAAARRTGPTEGRRCEFRRPSQPCARQVPRTFVVLQDHVIRTKWPFDAKGSGGV